MSHIPESLQSYIKRSIKTLHKRKLDHVDDVGILWSNAPNEEKEAWVRRGMEMLQIPYLEFRGVLPPREFMVQLKILIHRMKTIDTKHLYPGAVVYFPGVPQTQKYHVTGHTDDLLVRLKQRSNAVHPLWIACMHA
jgi:hypothetical protein